MRGSVKARDVDHGYKAMAERLYGAANNRASVRVGILASDADAPHGETAEGEPATILDVGIFNEFGTESIPARSFLRAWFDEHQDEIREQFSLLMRSAIHGQRTKEHALDLVGQWCVGQIQLRIAAGIEPDNAASTVARKGSSTPLIDHGILRASISYLVEGA